MREIIAICAKCYKPIYKGDSTVNLVSDFGVFHSDCFFGVLNQENITEETDEHGKSYWGLDLKDE